MTLASPKRKRPVAPNGTDLVPASRSMHETSLYHKDSWAIPEIRGVHLVRLALAGDAQSQVLKYGPQEPSCRSARFCVNLPRSPQHQKFSNSLNRGHSQVASLPPCGQEQTGEQSEESPSHKTAGLKFNKMSLQQLFREIDRSGSGVVSCRALIVVLQKKLQDYHQQNPHPSHEVTSWWKDIMRDIDTQNSGNLSWSSFLEFFRMAGLMIEYRNESEPRSLLMAGLGAKQEEMRKIVMTDVFDEQLTSEIRTKMGAAPEGRMKTNRRMGSPVELE